MNENSTNVHTPVGSLLLARVRFKVLKPDAASGTQAFACRIDPTHEAWVMPLPYAMFPARAATGKR